MGRGLGAFSDRRDAGRRLAQRLEHLRGERLVVLGLPRGGVPVAAEIARELGAPLDVILVRKLGVPQQPELGMGAIGEGGVKVENPEVLRYARASTEQIAEVERSEQDELERRASVIRGVHPRVALGDRVAVIVDDGIATGSTARAACEVARANGASRVVLAVPVAPAGWERRLAGAADEYVCVEEPASFSAIGQFYDDFRQLDDDEVLECLTAAGGGDGGDGGGDDSGAADTSAGSAALTYTSYLALDEILSAQRPRSGEHDEMLFIVVHQVYELWFKQLLHELRHLQQELEAGNGSHALHTLRRVLSILKVAVAQIDVLETMTPREFTGFRGRLEASSGFQSAQFRELEAVLGRRDRKVLNSYPPAPPASGGPAGGPAGGTAQARATIEAAMSRPSLFDSYLRYLARAGYAVPDDALRRDFSQPLEPSDAVQDLILAVYHDDGEAAQVAERFVDLDEGLQEWRYRHVKMVERTIGDKPGTGGSAGARYLRGTLSIPAFPDLWAVRGRL